MANISSLDIPQAVGGDALRQMVLSEHETRVPLAEGFLYEETSLLISAEPGCGKSTISTQAAIELATGLPLFGFFHVPKPVKVLYIMCERSKTEVIERIKTINNYYPINYDNLVLTDEYQKLDYIKHYNILLDCIKRDCPDAKVIFFDPIYATVMGGLSQDVVASMFTRVMTYIAKNIGCTNWYNHHTVKATYGRDGQKINKDDPFYGSQWLKAHATGCYHMKSNDKGVNMIVKKDNYKILTERIELEYNPESELSYLSNYTKLSPKDRVLGYLRGRRMDRRSFTFADLEVATQVCTRTLRGLVMHSSINDHLNVEKGPRNKNIYTVKECEF